MYVSGITVINRLIADLNNHVSKGNMFEKNSITIVEFIVILIVTTFLFFQIDMVKYGVYIQSSSILIFTITAIIGILTYINQLDDRNKI